MFPDEAANNGSNGTVLASFVVCEDGSICNFKIVKSPDESLSKETLRVIKKMPNWTPGTKDGKAVKVNYLLPIKFIMADDFEPVKPIKVITISKQELLNSNLSDFHTAKGKIKKFEYSYQDNLSEIVESNKLSKKLKKIIKASQSNDEILMKIFVGKNTDFEKVKIIIN